MGLNICLTKTQENNKATPLWQTATFASIDQQNQQPQISKDEDYQRTELISLVWGTKTTVTMEVQWELWRTVWDSVLLFR